MVNENIKKKEKREGDDCPKACCRSCITSDKSPQDPEPREERAEGKGER